MSKLYHEERIFTAQRFREHASFRAIGKELWGERTDTAKKEQ